MLERVEELTKEEINELYTVRDKVKYAQIKLKEIEDKIARQHNIAKERYLEWERYYKIDGCYILLYYNNFMVGGG